MIPPLLLLIEYQAERNINLFLPRNLSLQGSIGKGPAFKSCADGTESAVCSISPYRTYDGVCNNHQHKAWGAGMRAFKRELTADYADGKVDFFPSGLWYNLELTLLLL